MRIRGLGAVLVAILLIFGLLMSSVAMAKGVTKTKTPEDSSEETQQAPEVQQPPPLNHRDDSSSSTPRTDSAPVYQYEERRDDSTSDQPTYSTPEQRGPGTPDVSGQTLKREERRDPDYEYRHHYADRFFYPYDNIFYRNYPYYDRGTVVIIDQDTWGTDRHRWRRQYEYQNPSPGSLDEALVDIEATWREGDPELLMWHVDHLGGVDIYYNGKFSHTLAPREIYKLTDEAIGTIHTADFRFTSIDRHALSARVKATHEYVGPDSGYRTAYLVYYLEKVRDRWVIDRIDIRTSPYGSPKCFIATAAYGTPMEKHVLALRRFRDDYMLTNRPGRAFVAWYYRISPPIARGIEHSSAARAIVRGLLSPVVQLCEAVVPNAGE